MRRLTLPSFALLSGCAFGLQPMNVDGSGGVTDLGGDADTDTDSDSDSDSDSDTDSDTDSDVVVVIDAITPAYGTTAGGTDVLIQGTFEDDASVRFGGIEADVLSVNSRKGELYVRTPEGAAEGPVSVAVSSGSSTETADDGFMYYQDATGQTGIIGALNFTNIVGDYWTGTPVDFGYGWFFFSGPSDFTWSEYYAPATDQCRSEFDYLWSGELSYYEVGAGSTAELRSGSKSIDLRWSTANLQFESGDLVTSDFAFDSTYDLVDITPAEGLPEMDMPDAAYMPAAFSVSVPAIAGAAVPKVSSGFSVAWSGGSAGDGVILYLQLLDSGGNSQEIVTCSLRDDGAHNVPSSTWTTNWVANRQLNIIVIRYSAGTGVVPFNNANSQMTGEYAVYGAAFTK